jgi:hypothetical protein
MIVCDEGEVKNCLIDEFEENVLIGASIGEGIKMLVCYMC